MKIFQPIFIYNYSIFMKIDYNKMCLNNINFPPLQIDIDIFYRSQSYLTSQTEHQSRLGIVGVSFRDRVDHIHNLTLAPTLIITILSITVIIFPSLVSTSPRKVFKEINSLNLNRSPGLDGICAYFIRLACDIIAIPLSILCNLLFSEDVFQIAWKMLKLFLCLKLAVKANYQIRGQYYCYRVCPK